MGSAALFDLLPDFGARPLRVGPVVVSEPVVKASPPQQPNNEALIIQAVAIAETALRTRLNSEHEAALEAERQANADEASAFMETLGADLGARVASQVAEMETRVIDLVASTVARIISGLVSEDLKQRSIEALARSVRDSIGDVEAVRVRVHGPLSLFEALKTSLGSRAANLDFTEAPGFDLAVTIDDTVFETRMAEWSAALAEVLS